MKTFKPKTKVELKDEIKRAIKEHGNNVDLNYIDTSLVTDMSGLFIRNTEFNGNISKWDVSNVKDMSDMFFYSKSFNQDISNWDVSNVKHMFDMFCNADSFNQDLSNWNLSNLTHEISSAFYSSKLEDKAKLWFPEGYI